MSIPQEAAIHDALLKLAGWQLLLGEGWWHGMVFYDGKKPPLDWNLVYQARERLSEDQKESEGGYRAWHNKTASHKGLITSVLNHPLPIVAECILRAAGVWDEKTMVESK